MDRTRYPNTAGNRLLHALARYQYLTSDLATRATGYVPKTATTLGSHNYVVNTLTWLTKHNYTIMFHLPNEKGKGTTEGVWALYDKGRKYLHAAGLEQLPPYHSTPEMYFLKHVLAVNEVLIACERFATDTEGVSLKSFAHDHMLKREPITVALASGKKASTSADGIVELTAFGHVYTLWLELDRGTEVGKQWKRKIEALVRYAETLGDKRLDVMVVTTAGDRRLQHLLEWTAEQLMVMRRESWADMFRMIDVMPQPGNYGAFFCAPHWARPFEDQLYSLIVAPEEAWP